MNSYVSTLVCSTLMAITLLVNVRDIVGKPWAEDSNRPPNQPPFLDFGTQPCTRETESICQRCAKQTESPVVYPWCCANHEGAREWCENYLFYGMQ